MIGSVRLVNRRYLTNKKKQALPTKYIYHLCKNIVTENG